MNTGPAMLFPSALVLNDRSTFSVDACRLDRPRVSYATCNPFAIGDNQKNLSYPDPMVGASHSFIHRMSELSCLEGETVRQEKLKSIRKTRKHDS
ncbi:putative uncharacterized protein C8orf89 [Lampris incognitus]|uniref:putative uncharacterized protein C8orf89 n=1 Tax=Lampris incognitus TaxID=2546036 RepID=UPI0024B632D6|nr:putative uncharacterized protein C8orf89 [Lampris incognitus]